MHTRWFADDDGEDEDLKPAESEGGADVGKYDHDPALGLPDSDEAIDNSRQ